MGREPAHTGGTRPGPFGRHKRSGLQWWANGRPLPLEDNSVDPLAANYGYQQLAPRYNFDQWASFARSQHETMLVHVNYGTGTPSEAAAWVRYANLDKHYGVRYWEVGEEAHGDGGVGPPSSPTATPLRHRMRGTPQLPRFYQSDEGRRPGIQIGRSRCRARTPPRPVTTPLDSPL